MSDTPSNPNRLGGVIHTYQKYDPVRFPSPSQPAPDMVSPAFEHLLEFGSMEDYTPEQLANAIRIDPSQLSGFGPSIDALKQQLLDRKKKILETYETDAVVKEAAKRFRDRAAGVTPPDKLKKPFDAAVAGEQLAELEELYFSAGKDRDFGKSVVQLAQNLGDKYQIDELAGKYDFTGRQKLSIPTALEVKEELDTIEKLLKQLQDAKKNAQLAIIDMEELNEFLDQEGKDSLKEIQEQVEELMKEMARQQGIDGDARKGYELTPKAYRLFQSKILTQIFSDLKDSRTGRHPDAIDGEGATESTRTKEYEFGDSVTHMDIPGSFTNALIRNGPGLPLRLKPEDIVVHRTRNTPKAATCVLLDMSGSMRYDGQYVNVKRMGLALDGLIRKEYPGDFLQFIEMFTFAKSRHISEVPTLMPKPVTIFNNVVRLKADMSNPKIGESDVPWHFTNIQHALQTARRHLANQDTPNRQVVLITDGLPTAHFEGNELFLLYPPDPRTEDATMREARLCEKEGITINIFLLQTWNQSQEDIRFAYRIAEQTKGRVVFTAGRDLDRFVVWDYIKRRKTIVS
jgi:uncharacterized protein with von Willebrand factor type A (vWA) domain